MIRGTYPPNPVWENRETIQFGDKQHAIRGWINSEKQRVYMEQVARNSTIGAEIGSWCGLSACVLAYNMPPQGKLYCIDTFNATDGYDCDIDLWKEWNENLSMLNVRDKVTPLIGRSEDEPFRLCPDNLDFIYVDGGHFYREVIIDILLYRNKLKADTGLMLLHDFDFADVQAAVLDCIKGGVLRDLEIIDNNFVVAKVNR